MQKENVRIRQLAPDDYDELMALWRRTGLHSLKPQWRDSRSALTQQLGSGVQTILGLEAGGRLAAVVVVTHDSRKGWINRLAVDPAHRRKGFATWLIGEAEKLLRDQGIHVIAALVESDNPESLALFHKVGYVEIETGIHYLTKRDGAEV